MQEQADSRSVPTRADAPRQARRAQDATGGARPLVDVVIAVHRAERPIARAVASVLTGNSTPTRAIVVAHNIEPALIQQSLGEWAQDPRVLLLSHMDGIASPAGPMNAGFDAATAEFVSLLGSDDTFEPGTIDRWVEWANAPDGPFDYVLANRVEPDGTNAPTPPVRLNRRKHLDGVRDRLVYRMSALGLIRRTALGEQRFPEGVPTGEDILFATRFWFGGFKVAFAFGPPGYLVHDDQKVRATTTDRPVGEDLKYLDELLAPTQPWMRNKAQRRSLLVKLLRQNLPDVAIKRLTLGWDEQSVAELAQKTRWVLSLDPGAAACLSRNEWALIKALSTGQSSRDQTEALVKRRSRLRSLGTILPHRCWALFHPQGPLRYQLAGSRLVRA
ncbi:glycosyltransferase family 2 protein [Buchananella felis]|uniref:glycosyltransferase family 2 protein n=1 Tax=Buchananella felis TaxID=3231492 RepID=UPI003528EFA6